MNFEFELNAEFDNDLLELMNYSGIYLFEINTNNNSNTMEEWIDNFIQKWTGVNFRYASVPNSKKGRVKFHTELKEWFPIYIGRSKNISKRIKEHIHNKMNKPTGALKLLERENLYGEIFRVSTLKVEVKNYDLIMPQIEKSMRNRIYPILGRQ